MKLSLSSRICRRSLCFSSMISPVLFFLCFFAQVIQAQQAPNASLQVERFATNVPTFRNNLCDRAQKLINGEITLDRALDGVSLVPAVMVGEFANFVYEYDAQGNVVNMRLNEEYSGLVPELLDEICKRAGCEWRNTYATVNYDNYPTNRTFLDLLIWTTELYDLTAEWWMRSVERLRAGATFTEKWYDATIILVTIQQEEEDDAFDPWGWLAPFDRSVWIMIVVTVLGSSVLHYVLEAMNPKNKGTNVFRSLDPVETVWQYATAYAGQFEFDIETPALRILTFSVAFWALLMIAAYTANLASFLVIKNRSGLTIESLDQAVNLDMTMCVWRGTQTDVSVTAAFPAFARSGKLKRTSQRGVYEGLKSGDCQIAITEVSSWEVFQNDETINGDCSLRTVGGQFLSIPASFGVKGDAGTHCTSLLRDVFDLHIYDMEGDGKIEELWDVHKQYVATVDCGLSGGLEERRRRRQLAGRQIPDFMSQTHSRHLSQERSLKAKAKIAANEDEQTELSLTNMGGVFLFHGLLCGVAFFVAFFTWAWNRWQHKRNAKRAAEEKLDDEPHAAQHHGHAARRKARHRQKLQEQDQNEADDDITPTDETNGEPHFFNEEDHAMEEGGNKTTNIATAVSYDDDDGSVEELRTEMNAKLGRVENTQGDLQAKLGRIEGKLDALLGRTHDADIKASGSNWF